MSEAQIVEIKNQCNKDIRNALVTLQFKAAGRGVGLASQASAKRVKANNMKIIAEEGEDQEYDQIFKSDKKKQDYQIIMMKDNPYTIFHALGKFLYNKSKLLSNLTYRNKSEDRQNRATSL